MFDKRFLKSRLKHFACYTILLLACSLMIMRGSAKAA